MKEFKLHILTAIFSGATERKRKNVKPKRKCKITIYIDVITYILKIRFFLLLAGYVTYWSKSCVVYIRKVA